MDELVIIDYLNQFGLTRQESAIYICLIQNSALTGYEVAKQTGISRSNVYSALSGLVEKGAAYVMEGNATKYIPVKIKEFCNNKIHSMELIKTDLVKKMPKVTEETDGYITIEGYKHIMDKFHHMIMGAKQRIYISVSATMIPMLKQDIIETVNRGCKAVVITNAPFSEKGVKVHISQDIKDTGIRLIVDSSYVLTGEITQSGTDTCLYSGQKNFVEVFKEALRNEIKLAELTKGESGNE